ncbi:MAG: flavodoxin-dependent (E)-4-hydroxy-3-methylbut-2-enyl-diphosphate synthase [Thermoguttaceae bacterium]|nr:flavodoxin-dependent (E)-4-hydroxy-3-methylbut-2-enyl-diphosphate synthase [Thermoguttaceae bacterium]
MTIQRRSTRNIKIGSVSVGGDAPVLIQSMCATKTTDVEATARTTQRLADAGSGLIRIAVDTPKDAEALAEIRKRTTANLSVDLQENYRLAQQVAPNVDKIRYNPGHLHHHETNVPWQEKVRYLVRVAEDNDCALRIGINCGSIDPEKLARFRRESGQKRQENPFDPMLSSALEHADYLESLGFTRFCVSIKDSDPQTVLMANRRFAELRPAIPLHLGVTEAGMPPWGIQKSRLALEPLLAEGIGDTLRVSLTVPNDRKTEEIEAGQAIIENVRQGNIIDPKSVRLPRLNIVSCPSCSRVQNSAFVELAEQVRQATGFARDYPFKIAVMGCRVNGPGETDDADLGLWCGPGHVNLKQRGVPLGSWGYDEIIEQLIRQLRLLIEKTEQENKEKQ